MIKNISNVLFNLMKKQLGLLSPKVEKIAETRLKICDTCSQRVNNTCGQCGCLLAAKTVDLNSKCPINKW